MMKNRLAKFCKSGSILTSDEINTLWNPVIIGRLNSCVRCRALLFDKTSIPPSINRGLKYFNAS